MDTSNIQVLLFQHIKQALPAHVSMVDEIADLLHISNDSAYRRIRGEKEISLRYSINRTDSDQVVICTLKALDQDKNVVGQMDDTIPAGERISQQVTAIPTRSAPFTASIARCRAE